MSPAVLEKLKVDLMAKLVETEDSVIIYTWRSEHYTKREILGVEKGKVDQFI